MSDLPGAASFSTNPGEMKSGGHSLWRRLQTGNPNPFHVNPGTLMEAIERVFEACDEADAGGGDINFLTTRHIRELLDPKLKEARDHEQSDR